MRNGTLFGGVLLALSLTPLPAQAFSTRVHIAIANAVREAALDAGDGTLPLRGAPYAVQLPAEDFAAIRDYPLAFRAGAIGPDNMVFPGMTDPSHALGRRPYEQCEALYQAAVTGEERAYALGCFLHGATDAVAHHYVNFLSGETFTLTPITAARQSSMDNVVRHIIAESAIQEAAFAGDPSAFDTGALLHQIPNGFVLRTYLDPDSPVWQLAAEEALAEYEAARAADPQAALPQVLASMNVGPADHLLLSPVYLAEIDAAVVAARADLEARIAALQDPNTPDGAELGVAPGPDGVLGTQDDDTDCAATCPVLFANYFTYVGLLAPRYDANQQELPSAFDKLAEELRGDLFEFHGAYVQTIGNLSARLNQPLSGMDAGFDLEPWEVAVLAAPLTDWSDDLTTLDYDTVLQAILPDWILQTEAFLQAAGVNVSVAGIVEAVFAPLVAPIEQALREAFIDTATQYLEDLAAEIAAKQDGVGAEYDMRLAQAASPNLDGAFLDHLYDTGLFAHAFNLTAATLANHQVILPAAGAGPASFDASYTPAWSQAGACDYLAQAVFPYGPGVPGLLTVRDTNGDFPAAFTGDSPVECHDGALDAFAGDPSVASCAIVSLDDLLADPVGSLSRAYPPALSDTPVACADLTVPGLPTPPPGGTSGGSTGGDTGGSTGGTGGSGNAGSSGTDGGGSADGAGGCACTSTPGGRGRLSLLLLLPMLAFWRRRRVERGRRRRRVVARAAAGLALAAGLGAGCGDDGSGTSGGGSGGSAGSGTGGATAGTAGTAGTTDGTAGTTDGTAGTTSGTTGGVDDGLLDALDGTRWYGEQMRDGKLRAIELAFDTQSLLWAEIRNPFGPARLREMRSFTRDEQGRFHSTVISPRGWPIHPENGRMDTWEIELVESSPRLLRITREGVTEEFEEGAAPTPTSGLTATVRVFAPGSVIDQAFCESGGNGFDYKAMLDFANGKSDEIVEQDAVAGVELLPWTDPTMNNQFSVTDLDGFDRFGGTELSDTFNFVVTYEGTLAHPGGAFAMREADDSVEDALWVFLNDKVGSDNQADLFLEVHGFVWPDSTPDEPSVDLAAGDVPFQVILVRCTEPILDVDPEIRVGGGSWQAADQATYAPRIDDVLFPPAL